MSQGRYVWIAGKKVYLNPELQKEWDKHCERTASYGQGSALSPASNAEVYKRTSEYILRFLMWHYFRFRRIICLRVALHFTSVRQRENFFCRNS